MAAFRAPDPGQLRSRITITRTVTRALDVDGYPMTGTETLCDGHAACVEAGLGFDTAMRDEARHVQQRTVTMRYVAGVDERCRAFLHGEGDPARAADWWRVIGLYDPDGRRGWLCLTLERVVPQ